MTRYKVYDIITFLEEDKMKSQYNKTITACFVGYIVQAIVNNFTPLLLQKKVLEFQRQPAT